MKVIIIIDSFCCEDDKRTLMSCSFNGGWRLLNWNRSALGLMLLRYWYFRLKLPALSLLLFNLAFRSCFLVSSFAFGFNLVLWICICLYVFRCGMQRHQILSCWFFWNRTEILYLCQGIGVKNGNFCRLAVLQIWTLLFEMCMHDWWV